MDRKDWVLGMSHGFVLVNPRGVELEAGPLTPPFAFFLRSCAASNGIFSLVSVHDVSGATPSNLNTQFN